MTWQMGIFATYRVAGSLPVLRWPFVGGIIAILCDLTDLFLMDWLGGINRYQNFDKYCDQVYMLTFLIVVLGWESMPRTVGVGLYAYRLVGLVAFELTSTRAILLVFPNLFEFWFLLIAGLRFFRIQQPFSRRWVWALAVVLFGTKIAQEYLLHYAKALDGFTAFEAVEAIWRLISRPLR